MGEVRYINKSVRTYEDEKIKLIESMPDADAILVIWDKLLCLAGKINARGYIYLDEDKPYTDEMLATVLGRPLNTVRLALQAFNELGMTQNNGNGLFLINFPKWQNLDALEKIRASTRKRVAKHRQQQKLLTQGNVTDTLRNEIEGEGEGEGEGELEIKKDLENSNNSNNKNTKDTINHITVEGEDAEIKKFPPSSSSVILSSKDKENNNKRIFNKMHEMYPKAFGKDPGTREIAQIRDYSNILCKYSDCTNDAIKDAFKEAATHNKMYMTYVYAVLKAWLGVKDAIA